MQGKRILLGITGGIAAYKIPFLVRLLVKQGAEVRCILTPSAADFVSPLVLATLSEQPVHIEFWHQQRQTPFPKWPAEPVITCCWLLTYL